MSQEMFIEILFPFALDAGSADLCISEPINHRLYFPISEG